MKMVFTDNTIHKLSFSDLIKNLMRYRDENEREMISIAIQKSRKIEFKDKLFGDFCKLLHENIEGLWMMKK